MSITNPLSDYGWESSDATHAHGFLLPVLLEVFEDIAKKNDKQQIKIIDVGCGNGYLAGQLLTQGYNVTGLDASETGIKYAKDKHPEGIFKVASAYDNLSKQFGNDWDIVLSSEVVEHLYDPRLYAINITNLLKPNGSLIISTPYHGYLKNIALSLAGVWDKHHTALWDGGHIKFWSYRTLKSLLQESGFDNFTFRGAGRTPYLWKSMVISAKKRSTKIEL
jgi:2-polyprenyl-3-methyl-5-hydroxy-6-metoxy-1,4-benzoquinol methylase